MFVIAKGGERIPNVWRKTTVLFLVMFEYRWNFKNGPVTDWPNIRQDVCLQPSGDKVCRDKV